MSRSRRSLYERAADGMLRAAVNLTGPDTPPWPGDDAPIDGWRSWLASLWDDTGFREAVANASPDLDQQVRAILAGQSSDLRRVRRAGLAAARYSLRYTRRSTPFGLFAGVTMCQFAEVTDIRFGDAHQAVYRPHPVALAEALGDWESDARRMTGIEVCVNTLATEREQRIYVPSEGAAEYSLAATGPVRFVLQAAKSPITHADLLDKLAAEYPGTDAPKLTKLVAELLRVRVLRSALRAAATVPDPADVLPLPRWDDPRTRAVAPDLRLDATVRLPEAVAVECETAATVLTRLATNPTGTSAWRRYAERLAERFGDDAEVPLSVAIDPDRGLGFPDGFGPVAEPPRAMSRRDRLLLELAGSAVAEGSQSVVLSGAMIERLEAAAGLSDLVPPHLELCAQVQARSAQALDRGQFRLRVSTVSRSAGSMTGRFWHLLPAEASAWHAGLPTVDPDAELAQLSFHAGRIPADLLTRAPQVLPKVVSVGEFRRPRPGVLFPSDLAVGIRGGRLYLAELATGKRLELLAPTAINFLWNNYTPPLARFVAEISRAAVPQVTWFDWGAAWTLPVTPALHYRRSILVAARWLLRSSALPPRAASLTEWADGLHAWMARFRVPVRVLLAEDDQQLPLDLDQDMHLAVLRSRLDAHPTGVVVLHDAPPADADGWIGGRAHSIVVPLRSRS